MARRTDDRWHGRPGIALLIRTLVFLVPIATSVLFAWWLSRILPSPERGDWVEFISWWVVITAGATVVLWGVDRVARRALPLATLYKFSLVFPDKAPSRYKVARKTGSLRDLDEEVRRAREQGLGGDRTAASETVLRLVAGLSRHDRATRGHSERVRVFTDMLAEELDLEEDARNRLRWAALLHDVGKMAVHADILNKPGKPDEEEWKALKSHPAHGARITAPLHGWLGEWAAAIEEHHEKYDGSGYPHGRAGTDISWGARIVAVADAYDTMTAARVYKRPMAPTAAREELAACAGAHFDPVVVRAFLNLGLGRLRLAAGPLSWLAQTPLLNVPARLGALLPQAAAVATLGAATLTLPALPNELPDLPSVAIEEPSPEATAAPSPLPVDSPEPSEPLPTEPVPTEDETPVALPVVDPEPVPGPTTGPSASPAPRPAPAPTPAGPTPVEPAPTAAPAAALVGGYQADPAPGSDVRPGQELTLTLTVVNPDGAETATANVLSVSPIAGVTLVPGSAALDGRPLTGPDPLTRLLLPDLAPGASTTVTYAVLVEDVPSGTVVTPVASLTSNRGDLVIAVPGGYTVANDPALTADIVSDAAGSLARGEVVTYTATLRNGAAATGRATGLAVELPTPAGLTYVPDSARVDGAVRSGSANPFATPTTLSALAPGEEHVVRISFRVPSGAADGTPVDAKATFSRSGGSDLLVTTSDVVSVVVALSFDAVANPPDGAGVTPGTTIEYVSTVANGSGANTPAKGLSFSAPTPNDATLGPAAATLTVVDPSTGSTTTTLSGPDPLGSVALPDVPIGGRIEVRYEATVAPSVADGTAIVASSGVSGGDAPAPLAAARSHTVMSAPVLGLEVEPSVPEGDVKPGTPITYTATITNSGDAPATGLTFAHPLPTGATYTAGSAEYALNGGSSTTIAGGTNPFESPYALPVDVDVADTLVVRWSATLPEPVAAGTDLSTTATVTAAEAGAAGTRTLTHTALGPDLGVALTAQPSSTSTVIAGTDTVTYSVEVTNGAARGVDATSTVVTLPVPAGMRYLSGSAFGPGVPGGAPSNPFAAGLDVGTVPADDVTYTYGFTAEVVTPVDDGTRIDSGTTTVAPFEVPAIDAGAVYHLVSSTSAPATSLTVTSAQPVLEPDGSYTIVVDVANGPGATQELSGTISGALPNDSVHDGAGAYPLAAGVPFGPLLPGGSTTVTIPMRAAPGTPDGTTVVVDVDVVTDQAGTVSETATILVRDPGGLADVLYLKTAQPGVDSDPPLLLPLSPDAPTQTVLPRYTVGEEPTVAGHWLDRRGGATPVTEDKPKKMQHFGVILDSDTTLNSPVTLTTWAHVDDTDPRDGQLDAVLLDCAADLSDCLPPAGGQVLAEGSVSLSPWGGSSTGFVETTIDFGAVRHDLTAGRALVVKITVPGSSDDMVLAYDTTAYPSRLELDLDALPTLDVAISPSLGSPEPGDTITYTVDVTNPAGSPAYATGLSMAATTPPGTTYVVGSARSEAGDILLGVTNPYAGGRPLPDLAPGSSWTLTYDVLIDPLAPTGTLITADATADADGPVSATDSATSVVTLPPPPSAQPDDVSLTVSATPDGATSVTSSTDIVYTFTLANGPAAPRTLTGLQFQLDPQDVDVQAGTVTIDGLPSTAAAITSGVALTPLAPSTSHVIRFTGRPVGGLNPGDPVIAVGQAVGDQFAPVLEAQQWHWQQASAPLSASVEATPAAGFSVRPGDTISYTVTLTNGGPGTATGVTFANGTPPGTTFVDGSATVDGGPIAGPNPFGAPYALSDIAPSGTRTLSFDVVVEPGADGSVIVSEAEFESDQTRTNGVRRISHVLRTTTLFAKCDCTGDTTSQPLLPLEAVGPALTGSVPNFDTDRDIDQGLSLKKGAGSAFTATDPLTYQDWLVPVPGGATLDGPASFTFWSELDGDRTVEPGGVSVALMDCDGSGTGCLLIAQTTYDVGSWHGGTSGFVQHTVDLGDVSHVLAAGRALTLRLHHRDVSPTGLNVAYDVDATPTALRLTVTSGAISSVGPIGPRLAPWPLELDLAAALLVAGWWALRRREDLEPVAGP